VHAKLFNGIQVLVWSCAVVQQWSDAAGLMLLLLL
jgi:hypothetical protein